MKNETTGKEEFYFEDLPEHAQEVMIELIADIVRVMKSNPKADVANKKARRERNPITIRIQQE